MKTHASIAAPQRIVIYFVVGIVIPSIIMGVLAFRGLKNDQALVERENRRLALSSGEILVDSINNILTSLEGKYKSLVFGHFVPQDAFFQDSIFAQFLADHPVVSGIFYLRDGNVHSLRSQFQYLPRDAIRPSVQTEYTSNSQLEAGWMHEFQEKDLDKALAFYQGLIPKLEDAYSRALAFNAIARLQKKTNRIQDATETYRILAHEYSEYHINNVIPVGLIANHELATLLTQEGDLNGATEVHSRIQEQLFNCRWDIDESLYQLFNSGTQEFLTQQKSLTPEGDLAWAQLQELFQKRKNLERHTKGLLTFRERAINDMLPKSQRWTQQYDGETYVTSSIEIKDRGRWYVLTSSDSLLHRYLKSDLEQFSQNGRWNWSLLNAVGEPLLSPGENFESGDRVEIRFPPPLPSWTLLAQAKPESLFQTLRHSNGGIYIYLFVFIGAVLAFGLFFVFNSLHRELQLTKMKSDFVATVSHEFKSPLTSIRQITEMLQSNRVPDSKREKYYAVMLQQGARLTHLIDNILDFSKMERGKKSYTMQSMNISDIVQNVADRFQQRMQDEGFIVKVDFQPDIPLIEADLTAMEQVLHNLLDNAAKYSGDSRKIDIRGYTENGSVITSVQDYGIGITQKEQSRIFERFYRADNTHFNKVKGSGLGLTLVKEIIAAHGGRIQVSSIPGEGSIFSFILPSSTI